MVGSVARGGNGTTGASFLGWEAQRGRSVHLKRSSPALNVTISHGLKEDDPTTAVEAETVDLNVGNKNSHSFQLPGVKARLIRLQIPSYEPDERAMLPEIRVMT